MKALQINRHPFKPEFVPWNEATQHRFNMEEFEIEDLNSGLQVQRLTTLYEVHNVPGIPLAGTVS